MALRKAKPPPDQSTLPGYSGLTEIGGGAFATVYRAVETATARPVALKILEVDTAHTHLIDSFDKEIQALAKVSDHPNIVTLYRTATTTDGRPVLVLELCATSMGHRVRTEGPLPAAEVTAIGIKIAGALETAHRTGILHRAMKPENILLTHYAEPALADFGVAALQAAARATAGVFGSATLHAAPETLEGHHLSPATDVYGLASTMYQLIAGRAPFATFAHEAPASVILRIIRDPVPPLRSHGLPIGLADLLEAALAKAPEARPRRAADFARLLQAVEAAEGWGPTGLVPWGEEGAGYPGAADPRPPSAGPSVEPPAARPSRPPLPAQSAVPSGPAPGPGSPPPPPAPPPAPGPSSPPTPPPPRPRVGPSVATPDVGVRNVVTPVWGQRGQPARPTGPHPTDPGPVDAGPADRRQADGPTPSRSRPDPLAPRYVDPAPRYVDPAPRYVDPDPRYVDPDPGDIDPEPGDRPAPGVAAEAGSERSGDVGHLFSSITSAQSRPPPARRDAAPDGGLLQPGVAGVVRLLAVAGIVVAVLVLVAVALVGLGVI